MPLAIRPNSTYEVVLTTDMDLSENDRPIFIFRYVNCVEWEEIAALDDEFESIKNSKKMLELTFKVIKKTLCGWRNIKTAEGREIPFNVEKLKSMVSLGEAIELMQAAVAQRPSVPDKKKLGSQSGSDTAESAKAAEG